MQLVCSAARVVQAQLGVQVVQLAGATQQESPHHRLRLRPRLHRDSQPQLEKSRYGNQNDLPEFKNGCYLYVCSMNGFVTYI